MAGASSSSVAAAAATSRLRLAEKACEYLAASTDPFHAVANAVAKLQSAGFQKLPNASFANTVAGGLKPGGKYYYTVHHSTLVAFAVGPKYGSGGGFHIIGGHTDSPNLRVKPKSKKPPKHGCIQLGVECYGGGLWHTWFDRDLGISGKVLVRNGDDPNKLSHRLVQLKDPVARVSTLCIHLQTAEERKAFAVNKEEHTSPVVSSSCPVVDEDRVQLEKGAADQIQGGGDADNTDAWREGHEPLLLQRMAETLECRVDQIADFELSFFDTQGPVIGGIHKEFVYSGRLDNLATVFCAVESLVEHSSNGNNADDRDVAMVVCFDHEEVGSVSSHGAGSVVMGEAVRRISAALGNNSQGGNNCSPDLYADAISKSFVLSIDMAHAIHPNYASKHESQHAPQLNKGVVIKTNSNQRYATNSTTGFLVREIARKVQTPIQEVCVRNDCPCGSTIGPTISARTGMRVIDAGMPQLSMHSCREVMGVDDLTHGLELFNGFFKHFRSIDDSIQEE